MRSLLLFLAAVPAFAGGTYTCVNGGADPAAINSLLSSGGTTTLSGTCALGSTKLQLTASGTVLTGTATLNYTGSGYAIQINGSGTSGSPITVNGLTLNNAAIETTQNSMSTPQMWLAITNNVIQNVTNGANGLIQDGYWSHVLVQNNQFNTISTVPFSQVTTATNVENCTGCAPGTPDDYPCSWSGGTNNCFGGGIDLENGYDNTIIDSNTFNFTLGDAMRIPNVWLISSGTSIRIANNNQITNNRMINIHRMGIEANGGAGCIGSCLFGNYALQTNKVYKDNYISDWLAPYGNSFAWAIGDGSSNPIVANNSSIANTGPGAYGYELGYFGVVQFQGNTTTANTDGLGSNWTTYIMTGDSQPTTLYQNNYSAGPLAGGGAYFGQEGGCSGCFTQQYNVTAGACDTPTSCTTSNATSGIASFSNSGGTATLNTWVKSQIAIRYTQFFLDSSTTPFVTQELCNISTTFSSDRHWLYGASMSTSGLTGTHTIKAVATDLNGGTTTQTQSFTTGSGPVASFSPTTLAYGVITLGSTSSPQTTTLTNSGTTTLTISSGPSLTGTNAGDFAITGTTCTSTLAASATCTVTATFHPLALGSRFAFITIVDNASGSPHQVQLTGGASICQAGNIITNCDFGTGVITPWGFNGGSIASVAIDSTGPNGGFAAHITATSSVPPGSNIELFQDNLTFGSNGTMMQAQYDCKSSRTQLVNVLGILSVSPFTSYGLSYMQTFPTSYSGTYPTCKSPFFKVQGSPTSGSGRFTTQTDNAIGGDQLYTTNVNLVPVGSVPASQLSATSATFGAQNVGTTQTGSVITITNGGIANLVISSIAYSGGNASDFGQTNTCSTVTPGSTCTITPTFTPTSTGSRVSNLVITSNDSSVSPQTIPASGTGLGASGSIIINGSNYTDHSTTQINFTVDLGVSATSTAVAPSGSVMTITAANTFSAQEHVYFSGFTNETCLNGQTARVLGTSDGQPNPTPTQYVITTAGVPTACSYSGADTGVGTLSINVARNRSTKLPTTCTGGTGGLVQPMEIGPMYFGGLTFNMDVAGLDPATSWNICPEVSYDGGSTWVIGTGASVTTTALPAVHPALPIAPVTFDSSYPANTTNSSLFFQDTSITSSCLNSDVGNAYSAAVARQATLGTVIYVPAGAVCATGGNFNFAIQPVDVNTWHPSNVNTSTGQITLGGSPTLTVGQGIRFGKSYATLVSYPVSTSCEFGQGLSTGQVFFVASVSTGNVVTLACNNNGVPGATMSFATQGVDSFQGFYWVPANRSLHPIIMQPSTSLANLPPAGTQITPAWASKMFTIQSQVANLGVVGPAGAVITMGDSDSNRELMISNIRIMGAIITTADSSEAHTSTDPLTWQTMYYSAPQVDNIILDRCYFHNQPAPNRDNDGMFWNGYQTALINNYFDNGRYYHAEYSGLVGTKTGSNTASFTSGIENMGSGNISVPSFTMTLSGSGSGEAFVGLDMTASNALTVWTPASVTASCSPSCVNKSQSGAVNGTCLYNDGWQKNSAPDPNAGTLGNPTVGEIACLPISAGAISSIVTPQPWVSAHATEGIAWIIAGLGPGPYTFSGNYIECAGLCVHYDDGGGVSQIRGDYTHTRNYHLTPFRWMYNPNNLAANPASDGLGAYLRQPGEWKGGRRINLKGNVCDGNWVEVEASAGCFLFTSVNGMGITDVNIESNSVLHGPGMFSLAFVTAGSNYSMTPPVLRYRLKNNLAWDIGNANFYAGRQANPPPGWVGEGPNATQDIRIENNTIVGNIGTNPAIMWSFDTNTEGIMVANNFLYINSTNQGAAQDGGEPNFGGCPGLIGKAFADCKFTPTYQWFNNLMIGNGQTPSAVAAAWPTLANYFQAGSSSLSTVGWANYGTLPTVPTNGNPSFFQFNLNPSSLWKAGSSSVNDHGQDVGVNINDLEVAQGLVKLYGTPASGITTTGFHVSYLAPDSAICYVLYSTTNDITGATQLADAGGARARNTAVTGLAAHTLYFYWLLGQGNSMVSQRSGQVWTN